MGTPEFARVSLERLITEKFNICGVVTQPDKQKGRGHKLQPPPVKEFAVSHDIFVFQPKTLKDNAFAETLTELNPNMIVVVAYGKILPKYILDYPKFGCINVHASLLPKYRGAAPIHRCIIDGETQTGITTIYMADGIDTGDMILKREVEIGADMTVGELHDELATLGGDILIETIAKIADGTAPREPQDDAQSSYAHMLDRDTGRIDWTKSAHEIYNLIRGTNPYPGAFTGYNGEKLKIFNASVEKPAAIGGKPGEIIGITDGKISVAAGDKSVISITEVQPLGKKKMTVKDYLNGHKIEVGTVLG